ncbi:hypothetical protein [Nocardioides hwasunensis]|uniref:hypothetical protein n=1 Tax=Nocardioides hwasunensis TaxID=397258 RepID=UPI0037C7795F
MKEAVAASGASESTIRRRVRRGQLAASQTRPLVVSKASLEAYMSAESDWLTWAQACEVVGCSEPTLARLIQSGSIQVREVPRGVPSLELSSVRAAGTVWRRKRRTAAKRRDRRERRSTKFDPPDDGQVWVGSAVAAAALGITASAVRQRVAAGTLPGVIKASKLWLRRSDVEVAAASRQFQERALRADAEA